MLIQLAIFHDFKIKRGCSMPRRISKLAAVEALIDLARVGEGFGDTHRSAFVPSCFDLLVGEE